MFHLASMRDALTNCIGRGDCERLQDGDATRLRSTTCQLRLGLKAGLFWVDVASPTLLAKRTACGIEPRGTFKSAGIVRARSNVESRKENRSVFGSIVGFTSTSAWLRVSYRISVYFCAYQIRSRKMPIEEYLHVKNRHPPCVPLRENLDAPKKDQILKFWQFVQLLCNRTLVEQIPRRELRIIRQLVPVSYQQRLSQPGGTAL
jgi:hypothetical protein